jgi:hypothetical protein
MRGGKAPSLRRNATAKACNTAAPPGLVSPGGAATVEKRLPDGEMTFAIPVFVHSSNEFAMLWGGLHIPVNSATHSDSNPPLIPVQTHPMKPQPTKVS